ncbi:MAG: hypothetical protein A3K67_03035 [Euryarchaeota archaeon RBG_16_62_10]|nr:MAG: hypothetical protein A3K67_03035 [Euryarchaeota archaeon RBG_16_62_10]
MSDGPEKQFVVFRLGKEEYGIDVTTVREIHGISDITTVHRSARYIEGIINLRGKLLTVINLRKRFDMEPAEGMASERIVVIDAPDAPVGFLVDEVLEVLRIGPEAVEKAPEYVTKGIDAQYVLGIAKQEDRLITLVDPMRILELSTDAEAEPGGGKDG